MTEPLNPSSRSTREINHALEQQNQAIRDLKNRIASGRIETKFLQQSVGNFERLVGELLDERQKIVQYERAAKLYTVTRLMNASLELQTVLDQVMDAVIDLTAAERGFLMIRDTDNELKVQVARNFDQETIDGGEVMVSRSISNRVYQSGQAVVTNNALEDPRFANNESVIGYSLRSIMASPLRLRGEIMGVMYVDNRLKAGVFTNDDVKLLEMFGEQAAIAIDNAIQVQERERALKAQIQQLKIEIDEKRKAQQVSEIVESDYFQRLSENARKMRERNKSDR
jgi:phosphoserine phosphatase RsbU/P